MKITLFIIITLCAAIGCFGQSAVRLRFGAGGVPSGGGGGGGSSLDTNGLLLVWRLDEASTGDRTSSDANALVLVAANTPGYSSSGARSNAAQFSRASSQSLSIATTNQVEVQTNMNFSLTAWVLLSSFPSSGQIYGVAGKNNPGVNAQIEYSLATRYYGANEYEFYFLTGTNGAGAGTHLVASSTRFTATNQWIFAAGGRDATVGSNWISINGSAKEWIASPGPGPTITPFRIGVYGPTTHYMNGRVDEVLFWRTNLTMNQLALLGTNPPPTLP